VCRFFETLPDFPDPLEKFKLAKRSQKLVKNVPHSTHRRPSSRVKKKTKIFKKKRATSAPPKWVGLRPTKNRSAVAIVVLEKSEFYGTSPQVFFLNIQYFTSSILSLTRYVFLRKY
jgi:hypothetical protein